MFDTASLATFTVATTLLLVTPGPAVLFVVARSLEQGRTAGMVSMVGINSASLVHVGFAAFGLSALLMQSAAAFSAVKYVGAAYLLYLGVRTLMSNPQVEGHTAQQVKRSRLFTQGFVVNLLNPKTALFFLAFLPQFVDPTRGSVALQVVVLGLIFTGLAVVSDSVYALLAGTARHLFSGSVAAARTQKYLAGVTYVILGITTALSGSGRSK